VSFASNGGSASGPTWWQCLTASRRQQVSEEDFEKGKAALEAAGQEVPSAQPVWVRKYKQAFLGSGTILPNPEGETIEDIDGFSLAFMTGTWDRNKRYHYGLVRPLLDPQRIVNKSLVQTHQILNTNAKGGMIAKRAYSLNPAMLRRTGATPARPSLLPMAPFQGIGSRIACAPAASRRSHTIARLFHGGLPQGQRR
jgi:hypothetical protein